MRGFKPTPRFAELLDALLLGDAQIRLRPRPELTLKQNTRALLWVDQIEREWRAVGLEPGRTLVTPQGGRGTAVLLRTLAPGALLHEHARWYVRRTGRRRTYRKQVPKDVRLSTFVLAHWYAHDGHVTSGGYSVRLHTHAFEERDVRFLAHRLEDLYGWRAEAYPERQQGRVYWGLRLSRSDDRIAFIEAVRPYLPAGFEQKLAVRRSRPCTALEEQRRRHPRKVTARDVPQIRVRSARGEPYKMIARDYNVSEQHIGRIVRGERWSGHVASGHEAVPAAALARQMDGRRQS